MDPTQFQLEEEKLRQVTRQFEQIGQEEEELLRSLPEAYRHDPVLLVDLQMQVQNRIVRIHRAKEKPYFARIDFCEGHSDRPEVCYIGKIGVIDGENHTVTVDWRAPISTLYYDSNVGPVTYQAPAGTITGALTLKRQLEVEGGRLLSYNDVDTVANDELLKPYLGVNADNRLKNIVASIQQEQNRIIRERLEQDLVVQGVAGSGKTTVALHRIAYLVYNHRDKLRPGQFMVLGPNQFFINYISAVLPDLDVGSVPQFTFQEFARCFVGEAFTVADSSQKLIAIAEGANGSPVDRMKTSLAYRDALDRFLLAFDDQVAPDSDFSYKGFPLLTREQVREAYASLSRQAHNTVQSRVEMCILRFSTQIRNALGELTAQVDQLYREKRRQPGADLERLQAERAAILKELGKGCRAPLRKFFARGNTRILALYREFLQNCEAYLPPDFEAAPLLKKQTLASLRRKVLDPEDLPALIYLKERMSGPGQWREMRHTVVDEAQDFGPFDFYALSRALPGCAFTIVGDLAQSIYSYRGVEDWSQVTEQVFGGEASLCQMHKSYRTTVEIMEAANLVTTQLGMPPAQPVIRHGEPVALHPLRADGMEQVAELVREHLAEGFSSVAVIAKTLAAAHQLGEALRERGIAAVDITPDSTRYTGGVCTITGYLAKGLEFDGVILTDASEEVYSSARRMDLHLLYVSMTRPLHRLDILWDGTLCLPLEGLL